MEDRIRTVWVLGIETAGDVGSVALWREGEVPFELRFPARRRHAERLAPAVRTLLAEAGVAPTDLGLIAVDIGPGSFTGVRIGVSFAKGMAQAMGVPSVGVRQTEALGLPVAAWFPGRVASLVHDRRDLLYFAWAFPGRAGRDESLPLDRVLEKLREVAGELCLVGSGALRFRAELARALPGVYILGAEWAYPGAGVVAQLGYKRFRDGAEADPKALEPNYVQPPLAKEGNYG
ncbi:MAG: tRNA (adenosine(37)-N6)-threonylcarbamoyltransferase complex dimerization subunit type 1 TsaB [Caldiserica bacterium]|nr:tRNA (adenosine(37)-N6)-threonylcarbamoyltransferase complex dimerization subunit type 1 TsaB [Caldisericota bacterium]